MLSASAKLLAPLLLIGGVMLIDSLNKNRGSPNQPQDVVIVVQGRGQPNVVAGPAVLRPERGHLSTSEVPVHFTPIVTASAPSRDALGDQTSLNSAAIVQIADHPPAEEGIESDATLPDGVLTLRGY